MMKRLPNAQARRRRPAEALQLLRPGQVQSARPRLHRPCASAGAVAGELPAAAARRVARGGDGGEHRRSGRRSTPGCSSRSARGSPTTASASWSRARPSSELHEAWARVGYPFASLVPSYATAIGSSADRPAALAELVGIILNDGVRQPTVRIEEIELAEGTPYETHLVRPPERGERHLSRRGGGDAASGADGRGRQRHGEAGVRRLRRCRRQAAWRSAARPVPATNCSDTVPRQGPGGQPQRRFRLLHRRPVLRRRDRACSGRSGPPLQVHQRPADAGAEGAGAGAASR